VSTPDGLPPLRDVIGEIGLTARKRLGQNFILDLNLTRRIARAAGPLAGVTVLEIGPGPGGLTRGLLLEGAEKVIAIERDPRCLPALEAIAAHYPGRLDLIEGDALSIDQAAAVCNAPGAVKVVANLPYAVATPLLVGWLSADPWPPWYALLCLMFQREVAERLVAPPGNKVYGRLSVLAQWRCETQLALSLPPAAFTPPPKVSSAVVTLRATPEDGPHKSRPAYGRCGRLAERRQHFFERARGTAQRRGFWPPGRRSRRAQGREGSEIPLKLRGQVAQVPLAAPPQPLCTQDRT